MHRVDSDLKSQKWKFADVCGRYFNALQSDGGKDRKCCVSIYWPQRRRPERFLRLSSSRRLVYLQGEQVSGHMAATLIWIQFNISLASHLLLSEVTQTVRLDSQLCERARSKRSVPVCTSGSTEHQHTAVFLWQVKRFQIHWKEEAIRGEQNSLKWFKKPWKIPITQIKMIFFLFLYIKNLLWLSHTLILHKHKREAPRLPLCPSSVSLGGWNRTVKYSL